jgi:hypothetical protein
MSIASPPTPRLHDPLPLRLLRNERSIDAQISTPDGAAQMLTRLSLMVVAGFAAHAVALAAMMAPSMGAAATSMGVAWGVASTVGFFAAILAGLPSYWFYGIIANVRAPAWRLAVELVRVQAVGAVVLSAALPFWLVTGLAIGADTPGWLGLSLALPFLCALPGTLGLYRSFARMREVNGATGRLAPMVLTAWWVVLFQCTAPATIYSLYTALS